LGTSVYQGFPVSEVETAAGISLARMLFFKAKKPPKLLLRPIILATGALTPIGLGRNSLIHAKKSCQKSSQRDLA
jgi:hypothetical protein